MYQDPEDDPWLEFVYYYKSASELCLIFCSIYLMNLDKPYWRRWVSSLEACPDQTAFGQTLDNGPIYGEGSTPSYSSRQHLKSYCAKPPLVSSSLSRTTSRRNLPKINQPGCARTTPSAPPSSFIAQSSNQLIHRSVFATSSSYLWHPTQ